MQPHRAITAAALVALSLSLTGCDAFKSESDRLATAEAEAAGHAYGERQAEIDHLAREVALYKACQFLVPVCPSSLTEEGERIAVGSYAMTGGTSSFFWLIVIIKLIAAGSLFAAFAVAFTVLYKRLVMPSAKKLAEAQETIASAERKAAELIQEAIKNAARINENATTELQNIKASTQALLNQKKHLAADLKVLSATHATEEEKLQKIREEIDLTKAEKDLMRGFD